MYTSIQVEKQTKEHLDKFKNHPRETYNEVLARMIRIMYEQTSEELSPQTIKNIEKSLAEIKAGKVLSHDDVKRKLGLK
jgi:predicted transcriptional regulator